jgi:hypothetical protein
MIFCSSKLPKDFFGESIQKDLKGEMMKRMKHINKKIENYALIKTSKRN